MPKANETFIIEFLQGSAGRSSQAWRRRGGKAVKRGLSAEQIPWWRLATAATPRSTPSFPASTPPA